jgi:Zn-dependent protease with chaperone function
MKHRTWLAILLAGIMAVGTVSPPELEARYKPSSGMDFFSQQQEIQAGQQAAADVNHKMPVLPDSDPISRYVQRLGGDLAAHAPGPRWPYSFHVVNVKEINAFALPGGPIYVNMGTIRAADNEAQLAGVMAHEISHVVERHATRAASKQLMAQAPLSIVGGMLGGSAGAQLARLGISFGVGSYFLRNSRKAESEADLVGTDIMYDTGYDPRQMAVFFEKLQAQGGSRAPQFLSDHPNPGNRAVAVMDEVSTLPRKSSYRQDSAEFRQIKQMVMGRSPSSSRESRQRLQSSGGSGSEQSAISPNANDLEPSESFRTFQHRAFRIRYPENWLVNGDNQSAVTIAPRSGISGDAVAYGVIISGFQPESTRSLDRATHELLASIKQGNPDLRQIGNDEDIRVNGVPGKSVDLLNNSPIRGQRERDWLVAVPQRSGDLIYLMFIAPETDFDQLRPTFENMLRSFHLQ